MLVRPKIVDDPPAPLAVDHRRVEPPPEGRREVTIPGDGLATKAVPVRVVVDGERDIPTALRDGYSTVNGMGMGLPGTRRLMDEFEISSAPGQGTTITARKWRW